MQTMTLPTLGKRYALHERIGGGGMGTVYRAFDRLTARDVALKRVEVAVKQLRFTGRETPGSDTRDFSVALAAEFKTLASLRHPHIISVLDYGFEKPDDAGRPQPYFTMELLEGAQTLLQAAEPLLLEGRVGLMLQTLEALAYLHRRGILHRDLKPGNVLVGAGQVKVLDFGLAVSRGESGDLAGTLAYFAPELLMGSPASEASDLYAVGIIFYEMFAGQQPFENSSRLITDIMQTPPELDLLRLSEPMAQIIGRLLAKQPGDRYRSAADVISALERATGIQSSTTTEAIRDSFLQAAQFIGREHELTLLTRALEETVDMLPPYGGAWLIGGESGVGKSRLVEEIRTRALVSGSLVLRGQSVSNASNPYHLWRETLRSVALAADATDEEAAYINLLVPDIGDLLGRTILELPDMDVQLKGQGMFAAIDAMVRRLTQPTLVILEDLHWATREDVDVLSRLLILTEHLPIMWLGTFRDDEAPDLPAALPMMKRLKLHRLGREQIAALSQSMIGEAGAQAGLVSLLETQTEGNVFFIVEVVRALAEEAGELDRIAAMTLPERVLTGGVRRVLVRRLERVPQAARPLLCLAAVMGRQIDLRVLEDMPTRRDSSYADLQTWLTVCAESAVLEVVEDKWRFAHDKLREALIEYIPDDAQRTMHAEAAAAMERVYADSLEQQAAALAYQWMMAGSAEKHAHYAMLAGDAALNMYAIAQAMPYYDAALALSSHLDNVQLRQLFARRGRALELNAQQQAAYDNYVQMQQTGEQRGDLALVLEGVCGCALLKALPNPISDLIEAGKLTERGLILARQLGDQLAEARLLWIMMLILNFRRNYTSSILIGEQAVALARGLSATEPRAREILAYTLNDIARSYQGTHEFDKALAALNEARDLWIDMNNKPMLSDCLSGLSQVHFFTGSIDAAWQISQEAYQIAVETKNAWGQGYAQVTSAYVAMERGDVGLALNLTHSMEAASRAGGLMTGVIFALNTRSLLYGYVSDFQRARADNRAAYAVAEQMSMALSFSDFVNAVYLFICALEGDSAEVERVRAQLPTVLYDINAATPIFVGLGLGIAALRTGDYAAALHQAEYMLKFVHQSGARLFLPDALSLQGESLLALGRAQEAKSALLQAHALCIEVQSQRNQWEVAALLAACELALGDHDAARSYHAEALEILGMLADNTPDDVRMRFLSSEIVRRVTTAQM
jgi:serine/threonine protein kinase